MATTYPFDPTGSQAGNRIINEQHIITPVNGRDYHFIVPRLAPFFVTNFLIKFRNQQNQEVTLIENVDWYFSHMFIAGSRATQRPMYGSISILNRNLAGVLTLTYNTVGGDWVLDSNQIAQIMADRAFNPRIVSWDQVANLPYSFPVIDHEWDLVDMVGMSDVVVALSDIKNAILATGEGGIESHILDKNNPHQTNAYQVGLGFVRNLPTANATEAIDGLNDARYTTPYSVRLAINNTLLTTGLSGHISDKENPHFTTADQVGAFTKETTLELLNSKLGVNDKALDAFKFGGLTPDQWVNSFTVGSVDNANKFNNKTYQEVIDDFIMRTVANSERLSGQTLEEILDGINEYLDTDFVAKNSETLNGRSIEDILSTVSFEVDGKLSTRMGASQTLVNETFPEDTDPDFVWTKIAASYIDTRFTPGFQYTQGQCILTCNPYNQESTNAILLLDINSINAEVSGLKLNVQSLSPQDIPSDFEFGWTFSSNESVPAGEKAGSYFLWLKTNKKRKNIYITSLTGDTISFNHTQEDPAKIEPPGITYYPIIKNYFAKESDLQTLIDSLNTIFTITP